MDSWLAIFGWFLVASAFGPALLFAGIVVVSGCQWAWIWAYDLWLRRQARRFEADVMSAELRHSDPLHARRGWIDVYRERIASDPEIQALILVDELEDFLESQS